MLVLEVIETIATLSLSTRLEVSQEVIIGGVTTSHLLHRDELLILDEEDAVAVPEKNILYDGSRMSIFNDSRLVLLDLLKDILAVVGNCYSR